MTTEAGINIDSGTTTTGTSTSAPVSDADRASATAAASAAIVAAGGKAPPAMTPAQAKAEIAKLRADKKFAGAVIAGQPEEKARWNELLKLANAAEPSAADLQLASDVTLLQQRGIDVGSEVGKDIVNALANGITLETRRAVEARRSGLMRDPAFRQRYLGGHLEARRQMTTINALMSARIVEGAG
jgi:hypothetical protein